MTARITLATVGTTGDVRPFVVVGRALVASGFEVRAVTWPVHTAAFEAAGIPVEAAGPHDDPTRIAEVAEDAASRGPMDQVAVLREFHLQDGVAHLRRLRELFDGTDLVVLHSIHALAHAAVLDVDRPWVSAVFDPVLLPTSDAPPSGMPSIGPANRLAWWFLDRALARAGRPLDAVLAEADSRQRGLPLFRARSPRLHLVACSPSIMRVPRDLPSGTHITGAWLDRSPVTPLPADLEAFLDVGDAPVVITFGSMGGGPTDAVAGAIDRLAADGRRVVVQAGDTDLPRRPGVRTIGPVDHRALFPRAAAVVHHGGAGTTHTACAAGVPSVVVPHVGDQRYWADRLHRLGVAPAPLPVDGLDAAALADAAVRAADDPGMAAAGGDLAGRLEREDGPDIAVRLIAAVAAATG